MAKNNKVPAIRFSGYTDAWEQRKLISLYKTIRNAFVGTATPYYTNDFVNGYFYLESNNVKNGAINRNNEIYITKDFYEKQEDKWLYKDDIVIVQSGHVGHTAVIPEELDKTAAHALIMLQNKKENFDSHFINNSFQTPFIRNKIDEITTGNTIKHILASDVKNIVIKIPSFKEQKLISQLFKLLDLNITLHQRKLEKLKLTKKALLQKLFPQNGSKFPELRFKGFTYAWEQCKLSSFTQRVKGNDGRMDLPTLTISASEGWLNQKDRFSANIAGSEQKNYTLLRQGELSYNHGNSKLAKYGVVYTLKDYKEALVPRVYHSFKVDESYDALFVEYYFSTKRPDRELGKLVSSGARMDGLLNIGYDEFINISISVPTFSEQKQIVAILKVCDKIITLHQRKLDMLKNVKKGLLQKMFV